MFTSHLVKLKPLMKFHQPALGAHDLPDPLPRLSSPLPLDSTHKLHGASERARERVWGRDYSSSPIASAKLKLSQLFERSDIYGIE